jgi:hypothetical protein
MRAAAAASWDLGDALPCKDGRRGGARGNAVVSSVDGKLAASSFDQDQLTVLFARNRLSQTDMVTLSVGHRSSNAARSPATAVLSEYLWTHLLLTVPSTGFKPYQLEN